MDSNVLRKKFLDFFKEKGHSIIPPASLVPENDPTVLFTTAGMHPLVPFLLGEKHPEGKKLTNVQPCIRTDDIDEAGDAIHHTFFEMLGNWSLGDPDVSDGIGAGYFKKEAIEMSFEFLTSKKWLGIKKENLAVSVFKGDPDAPKDEESKKIWLELGIPKDRIKELPKKDNWWGPAGQTGPCGPDTEMFYWSGKDKAKDEFNPDDKRWVEIWNDVFMQYYKKEDGKYESLCQKNVDTGMGLERMLAVLNGLDDDYQTDLFLPIIKKIEELSEKKCEDNKKEFRIIADHIKAATFIIGDRRGVEPSNVGRGYVVRKLLRRAIRYGKILQMPECFLILLVKEVSEIYKEPYPEIKRKENDIITIVQKEEERFEKTVNFAISETSSQIKEKGGIDGGEAFRLYESFGMPIELTEEILKERGIEIDENFRKDFNEKLKKHQELSRTASAGMFKGGLADAGEMAVKYHTATHLLLAALRQVLGGDVFQKGSNITAERLRFDFNYSQKLTPEQIKEVKDLVNQKIKENLEVICEEMNLEEAKKQGAIGVFEGKYGERVKVYTIGNPSTSSGPPFSREICGGPHVKNTGELGKFEILKEESSSAGVRRIKAVLE